MDWYQKFYNCAELKMFNFDDDNFLVALEYACQGTNNHDAPVT